MGKFPLRRPRIISKKFPSVSSSIDGVTESLENLVFSYHDQVERMLQKKHIMMGLSSLALLIVLGSFLSPHGQAQGSIFYPSSCLGGWVNPNHVEGVITTSSNADEDEFTEENSAVLPVNTNAELYCGNFRGEVIKDTKPTKILVSLALTRKGDPSLVTLSEEQAISSVVSGTNTASTTSPVPVLEETATTSASTSEVVSNASSTEILPPTNEATTSQEASGETIPIIAPEERSSLLDSLINTVTGGLDATSKQNATPDTVQPSNESHDNPVSYLLKRGYGSGFISTVFAESSTTSTELVLGDSSSTLVSTTSLGESSTTIGTIGTSSLELGTTSESGVGTTTIATSTDSDPDNQFQNNFLEVFYSFDGVTWTSLGVLNEISMKYRTFEIPASTSTSWNDLEMLQIKLVATKKDQETPMVYLDGIKVEVLYESLITHEHPDFARDTILADTIVDGIRVLRIINSDTNLEEVWYMPLAQAEIVTSSSTDTGSSTGLIATSTDGGTSSTSHQIVADISGASTTGTSTERVALPVMTPDKSIWKKLVIDTTATSTITQIVEQIKTQEEKSIEEKLDFREVPPDFASDTIKFMKGVFSHFVLVQIERPIPNHATDTVIIPTRDELWLYNLQDGSQERVNSGTSTLLSIAHDYPFGAKGGYLFWLSSDKRTLYTYKHGDKTIVEQEIPSYDITQGGRGEVGVEGVPWKVIIGAENFSFYSEETGEVFSDEDLRITESFRVRLGLDSVLDNKKISDLNLPIKNNHEE